MRRVSLACLVVLLLPAGCCTHRARTTASPQAAQAPAPQHETGVAGKSRPRTDPPSGSAPRGRIDDRERITIDFEETPIREVCAWIAEHVEQTIVVDTGIEDRVSVDFRNLHYLEAIEEVADRARCVMRQDGDRIIVEKPPRVNMEFKRADLREVIELLAKQAGARVDIDPDVKGEVTMRLSDVPWSRGLKAVVNTLGYGLVEENGGRTLRVVNPSTHRQDMETHILRFEHIRPDEYYKASVQTGIGVGVSSATEAIKGFTLLETLRNMLTRPPGGSRHAPPIGSLEYDPVSNSMIVTDFRPVVEQMRSIIKHLDAPETKPR